MMNKVFSRLSAVFFALVLFLGCCSTAFAVTDDRPDSETLHVEAYLLGEDAIGRTLHVLRSGYVRSMPNQSSSILTEVYPDDKVAILDIYVETVNPLNVWLKIDFYGLEGWVNASRGRIFSIPADYYEPGIDPKLGAARARYVGQFMMVTVASGKARAGIGQDYPAIEYIHRNEIYRIHGAELDEQGDVWLKIRIGSRECWIHSNHVSYIGD